MNDSGTLTPLVDTTAASGNAALMSRQGELVGWGVTARLFTQKDAWSGGNYELAIDLGERHDERLRSALKGLWQQESLAGCYLKMDVEPQGQARLDPLSRLPLDRPILGIATLANGVRVACLTDTVREENGPDWLYLGLPMGSLATAYPVGAYPFDDGQPAPWSEELDAWLAEIGQSLFESVPFRLGLIGWGSDLYPDDFGRDDVPAERGIAILRPEQGRLVWYPATLIGDPDTKGPG